MKQISLLHKMSYKLDRKNVRQHAFKINFIQIHTIIQLQVIKVPYVIIEFEDPVRWLVCKTVKLSGSNANGGEAV